MKAITKPAVSVSKLAKMPEKLVLASKLCTPRDLPCDKKAR